MTGKKTSEPPIEGTTRRPYRPPQLLRFGDLAAVTATVGSMGGSDGPGPPGMNKSQ